MLSVSTRLVTGGGYHHLPAAGYARRAAAPEPGMDASVRSRTFRFGLWCDRRLEQVAVRALLSIAIITSLLPIEAIEHPEVEFGFYLLFLAEFMMRVFAVAATTRPLPTEGLGAAVDANDRTGVGPK